MRKRALVFLILVLSFLCGCNPSDFLAVKLGKRRGPDTGKNFHNATKMVWGQFWKKRSTLTEKPAANPYKAYPNTEKIKLPISDYSAWQSGDVFKKVLSDNNFSGEALDMDELSRILFSADGIIKKERRLDLRTAPVPLPQTHSFSYTHPIEIYVLARRVNGIKNGLYHYLFIEHSLELINEKALDLPNCCFEEPVLNKASAAIILTGIPARLSWAYDTRGFRYMYMTAGAVSQNIYLECAFLGLASSATASFHDDLYNDMLGIDGENEVTLLLHLVGQKNKQVE